MSGKIHGLETLGFRPEQEGGERGHLMCKATTHDIKAEKYIIFP